MPGAVNPADAETQLELGQESESIEAPPADPEEKPTAANTTLSGGHAATDDSETAVGKAAEQSFKEAQEAQERDSPGTPSEDVFDAPEAGYFWACVV